MSKLFAALAVLVVAQAARDVVHESVQVYAAGMCAHLDRASMDNSVKMMGKCASSNVLTLPPRSWDAWQGWGRTGGGGVAGCHGYGSVCRVAYLRSVQRPWVSAHLQLARQP